MEKKHHKQGEDIHDVSIRAFYQAIEKAYGNWGYLIARSFVSGIFIALGATLGLALLIAILGYVLGLLEFVPIIGDFFSRLNEFLAAAGFGTQ